MDPAGRTEREETEADDAGAAPPPPPPPPAAAELLAVATFAAAIGYEAEVAWLTHLSRLFWADHGLLAALERRATAAAETAVRERCPAVSAVRLEITAAIDAQQVRGAGIGAPGAPAGLALAGVHIRAVAVAGRAPAPLAGTPARLTAAAAVVTASDGWVASGAVASSIAEVFDDGASRRWFLAPAAPAWVQAAVPACGPPAWRVVEYGLELPPATAASHVPPWKWLLWGRRVDSGEWVVLHKGSPLHCYDPAFTPRKWWSQALRWGPQRAGVERFCSRLQFACAHTLASRVQQLLVAGATVNMVNRGRSSPLFELARSSTPCDDGAMRGMVRALVRAGADVEERGPYRDTPLLWCCRHLPEAGLPLALLAHGGADAAARSASGETALTLAAGVGGTGACFVLLAAGLEINATSNAGESALLRAINVKHVALARALVAAGADPAAAAHDGLTPLMCAARVGAESLALKLLLPGVDAGACDSMKHTPLYWSVVWGTARLSLALLSAGADVDARTLGDGVLGRRVAKRADRPPAGATVLSAALDRDDLAIVVQLLASGADVSAVDSDGRTAGERARRHGRPHAAAMLCAASGPAG
jgi:ankyrin repeat protein